MQPSATRWPTCTAATWAWAITWACCTSRHRICGSASITAAASSTTSRARSRSLSRPPSACLRAAAGGGSGDAELLRRHQDHPAGQPHGRRLLPGHAEAGPARPISVGPTGRCCRSSISSRPRPMPHHRRSRRTGTTPSASPSAPTTCCHRDLLLQCGFAFDQSPVTDSNRTSRIPDSNRYDLSIGAQYDDLGQCDAAGRLCARLFRLGAGKYTDGLRRSSSGPIRTRPIRRKPGGEGPL